MDDIVALAGTWIAEASEILAIARYSRAAGNRDYRLFSDPRTLSIWVRFLPADCNLLVLKDHELNYRGLARSLADKIPTETHVEWLVLVRATVDQSFECWGTNEVRVVLADYVDRYVVTGRMPAWNPALPTHAPSTLSALVPRQDGSVHRGVY